MDQFETIVRKSYAFSQDEYNNDPKWSLVRELYNKNFLMKDETRNYNNLPKIIHQIWLGSPIPSRYRKFAESWKYHNPGWEYKLWVDDNLNNVKISDRKLFDSIKNYGQKSDYLRYHILNQFGGIYVDTDIECLKSFNTLSYADFLIGVGYPSKPELYNSLMGCVPHHPIIVQIINALSEGKILDGGWRNVFETTGGYFLTRNFFKVITKYRKGVVVLPTDYFYPFPNLQECMDKGNGRDYVKDCSYTVHYWDVSWIPKKH